MDPWEPYRRHLITHAEHPVAAPLHDDAVAALLDAALAHVPGGGRLLDLGCGEAPWLLRALATRPSARAVGVDLSADTLASAAGAAKRLGVAGRLELRQTSAGEYAPGDPFDAVLCVGATHAFGGLLPALAAVGRHLAPGGCAVVGEGFWERGPTPAALAELDADPDDYADLATTVDRVVDAGWAPVHGHISSLAEWDAYEWRWTGSLTRWALDRPGHPDAPAARETVTAHRAAWLRGYRGVLGFVTLVLRRDEAP
ncbi:SAM-dependent methyltransferase [Streptomyces sp. URMC 129]|uniref:SAM-dependent methyltransferase n=1 Tax=Streptomyces sp. URMC 129 TaxID=3423407 RepID=UPI003F1D61BD